MILRKATENDIKRMAEMELICFPEEPWSENMIYEDIVKNDRAFYIVADISDELSEDKLKEMKLTGPVIGYIGVWQILDEGHITNVAVDPNFRRKHIGKALVSTMIEVTKNNGISSWTLEVRPSNSQAIKLYEKMGFTEAGLRKGYYENNNEDALIMWRKE